MKPITKAVKLKIEKALNLNNVNRIVKLSHRNMIDHLECDRLVGEEVLRIRDLILDNFDQNGVKSIIHYINDFLDDTSSDDISYPHLLFYIRLRNLLEVFSADGSFKLTA